MASSVTVASPRPNNATLAVFRQVVDAEGRNVGPATVEAVLDDGESVVVSVEPNVVVFVVEQPRGKPVEDYVHPIPAPVAAGLLDMAARSTFDTGDRLVGSHQWKAPPEDPAPTETAAAPPSEAA